MQRRRLDRLAVLLLVLDVTANVAQLLAAGRQPGKECVQGAALIKVPTW